MWNIKNAVEVQNLVKEECNITSISLSNNGKHMIFHFFKYIFTKKKDNNHMCSQVFKMDLQSYIIHIMES